jgi:hypothetical protein
VTSPAEVKKGDNLTFTVNVSGGDPNVTPTYNWTISASTIESGQGTSTIQVNTREIEGETNVTATVEIGGFSRACGYGSTVASATTTILKKPEARKLDEFSKLKAEEEDSRLLNLKLNIDQEASMAKGYIIAYGAPNSRQGVAQKAADKAKNYLVKKYGVDPTLIVAVDGGYREQETLELWLVPDGAEPPKPTPSIKPSPMPGVKPSAAKPAATKPGKSKKS